MYQQRSEMFVPAFANTHQKAFVTTGMLARHKSHPSRHVPPILKLFSITYCGDNRSGGFGSNTANLSDPLAIRVCSKDLIYASVESFGPGIKLQHELEQIGDNLAGHVRQTI